MAELRFSLEDAAHLLLAGSFSGVFFDWIAAWSLTAGPSPRGRGVTAIESGFILRLLSAVCMAISARLRRAFRFCESAPDSDQVIVSWRRVSSKGQVAVEGDTILVSGTSTGQKPSS